MITNKEVIKVLKTIKKIEATKNKITLAIKPPDFIYNIISCFHIKLTSNKNKILWRGPISFMNPKAEIDKGEISISLKKELEIKKVEIYKVNKIKIGVEFTL